MVRRVTSGPYALNVVITCLLFPPVIVLYIVCSFLADSSESGSNKGREGSRSGGSTKVSSDGKPTRVRTVLNEKQLHTLRTCYNANPRPDALMKEQLVEMTGLSPRVIRVWFQNKRCKDKKKAILMKQQLQQEKVCLNGVSHI